jgi:hypothetical protein
MAALPAGDVASDVVGVVGQWAGLGGAAGGAELAEELRVLAGELGPRPGTSSSQTIASTGHSPAQALSLTPVHGSAITSVTGGSTSLRDLPVRPADLRGRAWSAGWTAC